jgi:hypothetical protein
MPCRGRKVAPNEGLNFATIERIFGTDACNDRMHLGVFVLDEAETAGAAQ